MNRWQRRRRIHGGGFRRRGIKESAAIVHAVLPVTLRPSDTRVLRFYYFFFFFDPIPSSRPPPPSDALGLVLIGQFRRRRAISPDTVNRDSVTVQILREIEISFEK